MNKKYNLTLFPVWRNKFSGAFTSMKVDARMLDSLQQVSLGGKIMFKELTEESRSKFPDPERAPHAFVEYLTPEKVSEFDTKRTQKSEEGI